MGLTSYRHVALGLVALALIIAGVWWVEWFTFTTSLDKAHVSSIDLRGIHVCMVNGPCVDLSMSMLRGSYPTTANIAFWSSLVLGGGLCFQLAMRVITGQVLPQLARIGYLVAFAAVMATVAAAYLLGPDPQHGEAAGGTVTIARHAGPLVLLAGLVLATVALAKLNDAVDPDAVTAGPVRSDLSRPAARSAASPLAVEPAQALVPPPLTLAHTAATLELSPAGLDARLDSGALCLVPWADVVGVVARRLPAGAPFDGAAFVDLISTPGATIRVAPWTKVVGLPGGGVGADHVRPVIAAVLGYHPGAKLDAATRACVEDSALPRQLVDADELASHDARLP